MAAAHTACRTRVFGCLLAGRGELYAAVCVIGMHWLGAVRWKGVGMLCSQGPAVLHILI